VPSAATAAARAATTAGLLVSQFLGLLLGLFLRWGLPTVRITIPFVGSRWPASSGPEADQHAHAYARL
jgi:hypothetical protein